MSGPRKASQLVLAMAFGAITLVSLAPALPAFADAPRFYTIPIDWTYTSTECGFPVAVHHEGEISIMIHSNNGSNNLVGVDRFHLSGTFANQANGITLSYNEAANLRGIREPDGSLGIIFTGSLYNVHAPGQGSVAAFNGRVIVHGDPPQIDFEAGRVSGDPNGPFPTVCPFLQ